MERPEPVAILCGGRGTRLQEKTHAIPKPLVEIGGRPIVWHVIRIYAAHGFRRFLLMTGYKGEMIERFAADEQWPDGVEVECLPTGEETPTGGRVARAADRLGGGTFALTYADGVADVDLGAALDFHRSQGAAAMVTLVRPHSQWGVAVLDGYGEDLAAGLEQGSLTGRRKRRARGSIADILPTRVGPRKIAHDLDIELSARARRGIERMDPTALLEHQHLPVTG